MTPSKDRTEPRGIFWPARTSGPLRFGSPKGTNGSFARLWTGSARAARRRRGSAARKWREGSGALPLGSLGSLDSLGSLGSLGSWLFWAPLGSSGLFWALLGSSGLFWALLGSSRLFWRLFWALLGSSGGSWACRGSFGLSWALLGSFGLSRAHLGSSLAYPRRSSLIVKHVHWQQLADKG